MGIIMSLPLEPCSSMILAGCSGAGKTTFVYRLLRNLPEMYPSDPPKEILYCYGVYQDLFEEMEKNVPNFTLHQGLPSETLIETKTSDRNHRLIVLDDMMHQVSKNQQMELLFTQGCHHRRLSVLFLTQNLYEQGKNARSISLNAWYLVLFKNPRGISQVSTLGQQCFPGQKGMLTECYLDCMKEDFGYLFLDFSPRGDPKYRIRSHIFPGEDPIVYLPKNL